MPQILVLLCPPESVAFDFAALGQVGPGVKVRAVDTIEAALPLLPAADILITLPPHLGSAAPAIFNAASRLRWVQLVSTGTDNVAEHIRPGVTLTNAHGLHGRQMSEAALAAMLGLARRTPRLMQNQRAAVWERFPSALLAGKSVGIVGLGAIASTLAPLCRALGMTVVGITARPRPFTGFDAVRSRADMATAVADLDYLVVLAPLSPATAGLIDETVFAAMKPGARLVNLARGGIVDEVALLDALDHGTLDGAALDVFAHEPLPADSPFWGHDRVIVTPHVAGLHDGYPADVLALTTDNLRRFLAGEPLINRVATTPGAAHAAE